MARPTAVGQSCASSSQVDDAQCAHGGGGEGGDGGGEGVGGDGDGGRGLGDRVAWGGREVGSVASGSVAATCTPRMLVTILLFPLPLLRALLVCSAIPKSPLTKLTFAALFSHGALACHCHTPVVPRAYPDAWRALYRPHGDGAAACSKKIWSRGRPCLPRALAAARSLAVRGTRPSCVLTLANDHA